MRSLPIVQQNALVSNLEICERNVGQEVVGVLIDLTETNYRVMFIFAVFFMLLAGLLMSRVREGVRQ
jgi:hypothetical protein